MRSLVAITSVIVVTFGLASAQTNKDAWTRVPLPKATLSQTGDGALIALSGIVDAIANGSPQEIMAELNSMRPAHNYAQYALDSTQYVDLLNCAASARKAGSLSAISILRTDCTGNYRDWFPNCTQSEMPKACALLALHAVRTAIEGFDKYCVGATAADARRYGCAESTAGETARPPSIPTERRSIDKGFDQIVEYTMFDQTLPDGKHPTWVYYRSGSSIVRVQMPTLDLCVVTSNSKADLSLLNTKSFSVVVKASTQWELALEIWKAAFERYMIVGQPKSC